MQSWCTVSFSFLLGCTLTCTNLEKSKSRAAACFPRRCAMINTHERWWKRSRQVGGLWKHSVKTWKLYFTPLCPAAFCSTFTLAQFLCKKIKGLLNMFLINIEFCINANDGASVFVCVGNPIWFEKTGWKEVLFAGVDRHRLAGRVFITSLQIITMFILHC